MNLGIQKLVLQLQELLCGSIYFVTTPNKGTALNVALSCLHQNSKKDFLRYLALSDVSHTDIEEQNYSTEFLQDIKAHVFQDKGKKNFLKDLMKDFSFMKADEEGSLFIVVFDELSYLQYEGHSLERLLAEFSYFASIHDICLVFVSYGSDPEQISKKLLKQSQHISGIASINYTPASIDLVTEFWRNENGNYAQATTPVIFNDLGYEAVISEENASSSVDNSVCYLSSRAFVPDDTIFSSIKYFNSNEDIFDNAMKNAIAATVFFTLDSRGEIDELAKLIYDLRIAKGKILKIIVIEKIQGLRASSEHFLLICGANFLFDCSAKSYYINAMIPTLKKLEFNNQIRSSFEVLLDKYHLIENETNGFLMPCKFIDKVNEIITQDINAKKVDAAFVWIEPKDGLTLETCVNQFKPKRGGDFCTVVDGKILLFLPTCRNGELSTTLDHTFNTEPTEMFKSVEAVYTITEIKQCVEKLQSFKYINELDNQVMEYIIEAGEQKREAATKAKDLYDLAQTMVQASIAYDISKLKSEDDSE